MSTPSAPNARRLAAAGKLLYGDRWQRRLAAAAGISPALLSMIVTGDRSVTADVERKLVAALKSEATRLRATADKLERMRGAIERDIG